MLVLKQNDQHQPELKEAHNMALLKSAAEAIWKLCYSAEACQRFRKLGVVRLFIRHLNQPTEDVHNSFKKKIIENSFQLVEVDIIHQVHYVEFLHIRNKENSNSNYKVH